MTYRPEIDGLRAIAVVPVILFHAGLDLFSGGFVGVDIFFVISGYLITSIIYEEMVNGDFSISRFYERRVRRILPALFFVSLVCIPFAWFWMLPREFKDFSESIAAVNLFASNFLFAGQSGYFAVSSELKPLIHTWTLAVEEQFYILFPLLLLILKHLRQSRIILVIAGISIASLALAEWGSRVYPTESFYLLPTRAWELCAGALIALGLRQRQIRNARLARYGSLAGLFLVLFSIFAFDETVRFPSVWTLVPVIGAGLIIVFAGKENSVGQLLSLRPLVQIGLISYSAYLWHQPLFTFARIRSLDAVPTSVFLMLSVVTLALAYMTWHVIEQPFRNRNWLSRSTVFAGSAALAVALIGIGFAGHVTSGLPQRLVAEAAAIVKQSDDRNERRSECYSNSGRVISPNNACTYNEASHVRVAIWGDSHANGLSPQLANAIEPYRLSLTELTFTACPPALGYRRMNQGPECARFNRDVLDFLESSEQIKVVVLLAKWTHFMEGTSFDNREGGIEIGRAGDLALPLDERGAFINDSLRIERLGTLIRDTVEALLEHGKRVVLIYPVPEVGWHVPSRLAREIQFGIERKEPLSTSYAVFETRTRNTYEQLGRIDDHENLVRVFPESIFCNTFVMERCAAQRGRDPLYYDSHHLNSLGNALLADRIVDAMKAKGWL